MKTKTDKFGNVILTDDGIIDLLYAGEDSFENLPVEETDEVTKHNKWQITFDHEELVLEKYQEPTCSIEEFDRRRQKHWFIPDKYKVIEVEDCLLQKCSSDRERQRVSEEMKLFKERDMEGILRCLIYLVDYMRERGIVWGVGRGSSCASFCLYLIGIHKVNSLKYHIDIHEFLK